MRRLPSWAWTLLPLALGLLYAALWPLAAPAPSVADVVPAQAVVSARYRGTQGLDQLWCFGGTEGIRPTEDLAERHNLPGLAGVDPSGFFHWVLLPRSGRADATMWLVPVADADALRARFDLRDGALDASLAYRRHAKHLEVRGGFAALAWDREAVRHLGGGGITLADRGEDFGLVIDVPGAVQLALSQPAADPWRGILQALGGEPGKAVFGTDQATGLRALVFPFGRIVRVAQAWRTARMWAWAKEKRVEIELEPASAALRARLAKVAGGSGPANAPAPAGAAAGGPDASLWIAGRDAFDALALALLEAGVRLPEALASPTTDAPLGITAFRNQADARAWTLALDGDIGAYTAALEALLGPLPAPGAAQPLAAGAAPLTVATTREAYTSPAGEVRRSADGTRLVVGADAERLAQAPARADAPSLSPAVAGRRLLATATLGSERALDLLGPALQPRGLFAALGPGALRIVLTTDGARIFVTLERA